MSGLGWGLGGRVFAVLGVGPGLGLETARLLRQAGATVVCVDIDRQRALEAADSIGGVAATANIQDEAGFDAVLDAVRDAGLGPLRGIVDVVGGSIGGLIQDADEALITRNYELNLQHAFRVLRRGGDVIGASGGGSITFVGSLAGVVSSPQQAVYGSAKAALHHLVKSAGVELGAKGVRVNAVAPGLVATPRMLQRFSDEEFEQVRAASPLGRILEPVDIARVILFLASDMSGAMTSQAVVADGGFSAQPRMFG